MNHKKFSSLGGKASAKVITDAKREASRRNGKLGGRPVDTAARAKRLESALERKG